MNWSSRKINGEEAFRLGYANRLCEDGECVGEAQQYLKDIAQTSAPMSIMMMKRQIYKHLSKELGDAMSESNVWMDESLARSDFKEGVASFVERRAPRFEKINVSE
jgi:enoyl-CoA hydratase/carnithine racemase